MTFQDYFGLTQDSVSIYFENFLPVFTNIVAAVIIIAVGVLVGWILKRIWELVSESVGLEKSLSGLPLYNTVVKSHDDLDVTTYLGEALRWSAIIVFLIPGIASLQIEGSEAIFSQLWVYITNLVLASLYLLFAFVLGWFVHRIIMAALVVFGNTPSHLVANVAYLAIVVFAAFQALVQLGVAEEPLRLIVIAFIAAVALAFGLAGKDLSADLIKKFIEGVKK